MPANTKADKKVIKRVVSRTITHQSALDEFESLASTPVNDLEKLIIEMQSILSRLSDVSAHGTVLRDCVVEGLRFIFPRIGVEDDEEPKDRASETRDDEGACRAGREGYPACDAQAAFF